jgi:raffinose/stachyose/melibiose transport system permease protein
LGLLRLLVRITPVKWLGCAGEVIVVIHKDSLRTLPVGMAFFQGRYVGDTPLIAMGASLMTLPIIVIYILLQKYVISGITAGALKE